jgi:hypothetical protein
MSKTASVPEVIAPTLVLSTFVIPAYNIYFSDPSKPEYWAYQADGRHTKLRIHLHGCSKTYVEAAAQDYLRTTKTESLSDRIEDLEKFQTYFRKYEAHLLQLDGVSDRWRKVREMTFEVGDIIRWLEQLLCEAMTGILTFQVAYLAKGFAYQRE